ncbi:MAG: alpha/beta hydrolase [Alphaproteobacteria bacterium]
MSVNPQIQAFLDQLAQTPAPQLWEMPLQEGRELYRMIARMTDPHDVSIGKVENTWFRGPAGDVAVRIYTPVAAGGSSLPGVVFFHGGGFVLGDLDTHDALCRQLANASGCRVMAVDYRRAPEHRFPAAVDDAFAAVKWIDQYANDLGVDANRIAVAGDSAGGNLAAVVSQMARKSDADIAYQLLIYPTTEAKADTESARRLAEGYFLERRSMDWFYEQYCPECDPADPRLSPLRADDLSGLPPAYVVVAGFDPLHDEGVAYARKMKEAGVEVELVNYPDMIHGFFNMTALTDTAREAVQAAGRALKEALG